MKLKKCTENPILSPQDCSPWESLSTCNPGVYYDNGIFYMLYRAAGKDKKHVIRFGLATSIDGIHFERKNKLPVFSPSLDGPDSGCVEDPRIVKFGDEYFVTYAYRATPPGEYWMFPHDQVLLPESGEYMPIAYSRNLANSGLAVTSDFHSFRRLGRLTSPVLDDRDVILFPEKINGKYVMLHRPKQYVGKEYNVKYPSIWIKFSTDLLSWEDKDSFLLITGRDGTWEEKVGGAAPPLKTEAGWLVLYHGVDSGGKGIYRVGALLLDLNNPLKILARTNNCILEPEADCEMNGYYNGCVFPVGNAIVNDVLYVYYGAADKYICLATCPVNDLISYLLSDCKVDLY